MSISAALQAQILRYHFVEQWRPNTIARQLHVHHSAVSRVLAQAGVPRAQYRVRASALDSYVPFLLETLVRFPSLTAARLYAMVQARGYRGSASQCRHRISLTAPAPPRRGLSAAAHPARGADAGGLGPMPSSA